MISFQERRWHYSGTMLWQNDASFKENGERCFLYQCIARSEWQTNIMIVYCNCNVYSIWTSVCLFNKFCCTLYIHKFRFKYDAQCGTCIHIHNTYILFNYYQLHFSRVYPLLPICTIYYIVFNESLYYITYICYIICICSLQ